MLIGTGYNTWGLASGVLAGKIISDIILNKKNEYVKLFDPKRKNVAKTLGGFNDGLKSIEGYINGMINADKNINHKCSHMGCSLIYNDIEKTWDCPCHGSRFDIDGKPINSPANKEMM